MILDIRMEILEDQFAYTKLCENDNSVVEDKPSHLVSKDGPVPDKERNISSHFSVSTNSSQDIKKKGYYRKQYSEGKILSQTQGKR